MRTVLNTLNSRQKIFKRLFDFVISFFGLVVFSSVIIIAWWIASIETRSNGLFIQKRVGRNSEIFFLVKIKTMKSVEGVDTTITSSKDVRITISGKFFRSSKIDELPQLWNVLCGHMSFVGPRPDVPGFADKLKGDDRIILTIRPGITGPASLKYKGEEELLSLQDKPEEYNITIIWPDKVRINKEYIMNYSFYTDMQYILNTTIS